jgi:BMFP domain-containing protein YqiC
MTTVTREQLQRLIAANMLRSELVDAHAANTLLAIYRLAISGLEAEEGRLVARSEFDAQQVAHGQAVDELADLRAQVAELNEFAGKWYCENHPLELMGHDGCRGGGILGCARVSQAENRLRLAEQAERESHRCFGDLLMQARQRCAKLESQVAARESEVLALREALEDIGGDWTPDPDALELCITEMQEAAREALTDTTPSTTATPERIEREATDRIFDHCKVVYYGLNAEYPLEHNPLAKKECRADIKRAIAEMIARKEG